MNNSESNNMQNEVQVKTPDDVQYPQSDAAADLPEERPAYVRPVVVGTLYTEEMARAIIAEEERRKKFRVQTLKYISYFIAIILLSNLLVLFHTHEHTDGTNWLAGLKTAAGAFGIIVLSLDSKYTAVKVYAITFLAVYIASVAYRTNYTYHNADSMADAICKRILALPVYQNAEMLKECRERAWFSLRLNLLFSAFYAIFAFILTWKYARAGIESKKEAMEDRDDVQV